MALDNAVSPAAAKNKGIGGPVAGCANVLLVPDIEAGNMMIKAMGFISECKCAGVVIGTAKPIIMTSRADNSYEIKVRSVALGVLLANNQEMFS